MDINVWNSSTLFGCTYDKQNTETKIKHLISSQIDHGGIKGGWYKQQTYDSHEPFEDLPGSKPDKKINFLFADDSFFRDHQTEAGKFLSGVVNCYVRSKAD